MWVKKQQLELDMELLAGSKWGKNGNSDVLFSWAPKSLWMVTVAMKLKDPCSLEEKL